MNTINIFEFVKKAITDSVPDVDSNAINKDTRLSELGIDSVKTVELGVRLEGIFGEEVVLDDWLDEQMEIDDNARYKIDDLVIFIEGALA